jgi:hypothetical protein
MKKANFKTINGKLTKEEMKTVMAGSQYCNNSGQSCMMGCQGNCKCAPSHSTGSDICQNR